MILSLNTLVSFDDQVTLKLFLIKLEIQSQDYNSKLCSGYDETFRRKEGYTFKCLFRQDIFHSPVNSEITQIQTFWSNSI